MYRDSASKHILDAISIIRKSYAEPFFLYDAEDIRLKHYQLTSAFSSLQFTQYFAVKALPHPEVIRILNQLGSGFDCASLNEIMLTEAVGAEKRVFTSNNTTSAQFCAAFNLGALITVDDIRLLDRLPQEIREVTLRVSLGNTKKYSIISGSQSKFGMTLDQAAEACQLLKERGIDSIGLHCMESANDTDITSKLTEALTLIEFAKELSRQYKIQISRLNFGGGIGIPYRDAEREFNLPEYGRLICDKVKESFSQPPHLAMECGRFITGASGYLVSQVSGIFNKPHTVIGLNTSTACMPRVSIYPDAYHHISFPFTANEQRVEADVVGSMCESMDKFCSKRCLPLPNLGDLCLIHDVGAHCISMANTYNGMLKPAEFLVDGDQIRQISRRESFDDMRARFTNIEVENNDAITKHA